MFIHGKASMCHLYCLTAEIRSFDVAKLRNRDVEGSKTLSMDSLVEAPLYATNPQQKDYNWLTAELVRWKMFDGKKSEGLVIQTRKF